MLRRSIRRKNDEDRHFAGSPDKVHTAPGRFQAKKRVQQITGSLILLISMYLLNFSVYLERSELSSSRNDILFNSLLNLAEISIDREEDKRVPPSSSEELKLDVKSFLREPNVRNTDNITVSVPKVIYKIFLTGDGKLPDYESHSKVQRDALLSWTTKNPGYTLKYFGLDDCRTYLKNYFHPVFLRAFDCIEAYAGKANLFRAAVVYREGGWYSDWKEEVKVEGFLDKIALGGWGENRPGSQTIIFTWDRGIEYTRKNWCIMNAFFGAQPRHPLLAEVLKLILLNVHNRYYGPIAVCNTGPCVYGQAYKNFYGNNTESSKETVFRLPE